MNTQLQTTVITRELLEAITKKANESNDMQLLFLLEQSNKSTLNLVASSNRAYSDLKDSIIEVLKDKIKENDLRSWDIDEFLEENLSQEISNQLPCDSYTLAVIMTDTSLSKCHDSKIEDESMFLAMRSYIDSELYSDINVHFDEVIKPQMETTEDMNLVPEDFDDII